MFDRSKDKVIEKTSAPSPNQGAINRSNDRVNEKMSAPSPNQGAINRSNVNDKINVNSPNQGSINRANDRTNDRINDRANSSYVQPVLNRSDKVNEKVILSSNQPGLIDTSTKRIVSQSVKTFNQPTQQTQITTQQPMITRKITRKLIPIDDQQSEMQPQMNYQSPPPPPQQQQSQPVQQMIWPVSVQFNEDDALSKIREEKILGLLERQSEMLSNMLYKYKRIEEDQSSKLKKRIKELERENEEIWQKKRQNYLIYNVAQSVDQRLKEFNDFQLKPWMDSGQPILLKPIHLDDKEFFDTKKKVTKKKKSSKKKIKIEDDGLLQDPDTGELWDPKTGLVVKAGNGTMVGSQIMQ